MTQIDVRYLSDFHTQCTHHTSGAQIRTDAPKDLGGGGKEFSPTDLLAASLASCMLTIMGMAAKKVGFDLTDATIEVEKLMSSSSPRRLEKLVVRFRCSRLPNEAIREKLEQAALSCPVHHSLHPSIRIESDFIWGL